MELPPIEVTLSKGSAGSCDLIRRCFFSIISNDVLGLMQVAYHDVREHQADVAPLSDQRCQGDENRAAATHSLHEYCSTRPQDRGCYGRNDGL